MRKTATLTLLIGILLSCYQVNAQAKDSFNLSKNAIYLDLGLGIFMQESINYERIIVSGKSVGLYGRVGVGYGFNLLTPAVPSGPGGLATLTMLTGKNNRHFELNTGIFIGKNQYSGDTSCECPFAIPIVNVGFRFQKPEGGFIYRATAGVIGIGVGLGYSF